MRDIPRQGADSKPDSPISQVVEFAQDKQLTLSETAIDATMIGEREIKLQKVSGTVKLVTKIGGTIYSTVLT